jgi:Flp pilus assembly protein TadG
MRRARQILKGLKGCDGSNLVEAAIIVPLLLTVTFAIIDFSSMFFTYLALENGVSQATRYAITGNQMDDPNKPGQKLDRASSIKAAMRDATPTFTLDDSAFTFAFLSPGTTNWVAGTGGPNDVGKVTVTYTWTPLTPILTPFLTNGQLSVSVDSAMKNESKFE